jgi:hypothetical protein
MFSTLGSKIDISQFNQLFTYSQGYIDQKDVTPPSQSCTAWRKVHTEKDYDTFR